MLTFEFMQPGEFEDPYYKCWCGYIDHDGQEWKFTSNPYSIGSVQLDQISTKLKQLNGAV